MKTSMIALAVCSALLLWSCKPDAIKDYEAPDSAFKLANLSGTWKMSTLVQSDEDAVTKGFPYKTVDLTQAINAPQVKFTINMNGAAPGTFAIDHGTATKLFKSTSGNWMVDDQAKPSQMWFVNGTDTVKFVIQGYNNILQNKQMVLKRTRKLGVKAVSTYTYTFDKQ
ncbi:MAG: DUF5004 domain-containing protein [Dinghuibacter sp.]|nr:DUF5004 domain-containing protein [Dinghuibacter sp.]